MMVVPAAGTVHMRLFNFGPGVGAAFRIERRVNLRDLAAKPARHVLDHRVTANANAIGKNLHRQVPVSEVIGEAREVARFANADFRQRFRRGDDFDETAVFQHERVAATQHHRLRKIEQKFEPVGAFHGDAPTMTLIEIEHNRISGPGLPGALRADEIRSNHNASREALQNRKYLCAMGSTSAGSQASRTPSAVTA